MKKKIKKKIFLFFKNFKYKKKKKKKIDIIKLKY